MEQSAHRIRRAWIIAAILAAVAIAVVLAVVYSGGGGSGVGY